MTISRSVTRTDKDPIKHYRALNLKLSCCTTTEYHKVPREACFVREGGVAVSCLYILLLHKSVVAEGVFLRGGCGRRCVWRV